MVLLRRSICILFGRGQRFRPVAAAAAAPLSRQSNNNAFLLPPPPTTLFTSRRNYSDKKLLEAVNSEIQSTLLSNQHYKPVVEAPADLPFEIKEEPWMNYPTLVREYKGDTVTIDVELVDDEKSSDPRLRLLVQVRAVDDSLIKFHCQVLPDKITIDSIDFLDVFSPSPLFADAPAFKNMGKHLQEAFHEYLDVRGVNMSTANFLRKCITNYLALNEENRLRFNWLKRVKHLIIRT